MIGRRRSSESGTGTNQPLGIHEVEGETPLEIERAQRRSERRSQRNPNAIKAVVRNRYNPVGEGDYNPANPSKSSSAYLFESENDDEVVDVDKQGNRHFVPESERFTD